MTWKAGFGGFDVRGDVAGEVWGRRRWDLIFGKIGPSTSEMFAPAVLFFGHLTTLVPLLNFKI
jgi:hypothetical protein